MGSFPETYVDPKKQTVIFVLKQNRIRVDGAPKISGAGEISVDFTFNSSPLNIFLRFFQQQEAPRFLAHFKGKFIIHKVQNIHSIVCFSEKVSYLVEISGVILGRLLQCIYVVVQFYPWFRFYFLLFQSHYHTLLYQKRKEKNTLNQG